MKIHFKVALVIRREQDRIARYVHISTSNYNAVTAHVYTDIGIFTADEDVAADTSDPLNYLTGYSHKSDYRRLVVAPVNLRSRLEALIERECAGGRGRSVDLEGEFAGRPEPHPASMSCVCSRAKVQLLVRGICCLRPGVPGISENIEVLSFVGRFLEHSRIFYFRNRGDEQIFIGSSDLMPRNIDHRVEVLIPIRDEKIASHIRTDMLAPYLANSVKARRMLPDGAYRRSRNKSRTMDAQKYLIQIRRTASEHQGHMRPKPRSPLND